MCISDTRALNVSRETYGLPIFNEYNQRGVNFRSATRRKSRSPACDIDNSLAALLADQLADGFEHFATRIVYT